MPTYTTPLGPPPTNELGAPGLASYGGWLDTWEETKELRFPHSIIVFDRMRTTDGQTTAVLNARALTIKRTAWRIGSKNDGVDDRVRRFVADELGVDLDRSKAGLRRRRNQGVVFADALHHALLAGPLGFMPLEQVYNIDSPGPGQEDLGLPKQVAHLHKLAPRMPRSVYAVNVAADGGLISIRQHVPKATNSAGFLVNTEVEIPADRLVMFCNDREGGDWYGKSILRAAYGHWLIKVALMRLGPMVMERNGMGVPVVQFDESKGHTRADALAVAKGFRAGEEAGAALPEGMTVTLAGVTGTLKDELPLLAYHDEAIGRTALAMVLNLGHDHGAKSLGETFVDLFLMAETATIHDIEDTFTEYVIRDLVELNFGADEPYPRLIADELAADSKPTAEGLKALADGGLLDGDPDLKEAVRRLWRLPAPMPGWQPTYMPGPVVEVIPGSQQEPAPPPPGAPAVDPTAPPPPGTPLPGPSHIVKVPAHTRTKPTPATIAARAAELAQRAADLAAAHDTE